MFTVLILLLFAVVNVASQETNVTSCIAPPGGKAVVTVVGEPGPQGPPGPTGIQGPHGRIGQKGPKGDPGVVGDPGRVGPEGMVGPEGKRGLKGMKGDPGPVGLEGPPGVPGSAGPVGRQGPPGPEGPHGPRGPIGLPGSRGYPGPPGETVLSPESERKLLFRLLQQLASLGILPAQSCKEVYSRGFNSSGNYLLGRTVPDGNMQYCEMEAALCGSKGGWMPVAHFNMENRLQDCPNPLRLVTNSNPPRRACARKTNTSGCTTLPFLVKGVQYTEVCGRVRGYQHRTTDGFNSFLSSNIYTDGVTVTRGSPVQHVWSYVAGLRENELTSFRKLICPCAYPEGDSRRPKPKVGIGNNYYCESGLYRTPSINPITTNPFWSDPLWDGAGCPSGNNCCQHNGWFHRDIGSTTDDIDVHLCLDEPPANEDVYIDIVEIYVR